jgi:hypothetical protein
LFPEHSLASASDWYGCTRNRFLSKANRLDLAAFEAICGQFYLAVLVAGLIGIRTTGADPDQPK